MSVSRIAASRRGRQMNQGLSDAVGSLALAASRAMRQTLSAVRAIASGPEGADFVGISERIPVCEHLEQRQLLTTMTGGGVAGNGALLPGQALEFRDEAGTPMRIQLLGNITAEMIFVQVDSGGSPTANGDEVDPNNPLSSGGPINNNGTTLTDIIPLTITNSEATQADLYAIYVSHADLNSAISIAQVPEPTAVPRPMNAFGAPRTIRIRSNQTNQITTAALPTATGSALLGTLTENVDTTTTNEQDIPINTIPLNQRFGVRPNENGILNAGLQVAPGQNLGRFFFGGTIIGRVQIGEQVNNLTGTSSMDTFYCGNLLTGLNAANQYGLGDTVGAVVRDNFHVHGDIRQIIVGGSIGCDNVVYDNNSGTAYSAYNTGVDFQIDGRVGQILSKASYLGGLAVLDSTGGTGVSQTELELRNGNKNGNVTYFQGNDPGATGAGAAVLSLPSLTERGNTFDNDTFQTAQYLGTAFNRSLGDRNAISVIGHLRGAGTVNDNVDYYAVSLMAGQKITVQLVDRNVAADGTPLYTVGVFDPDQRLIATDKNNINPDGFTRGQTFSFTADRPGAYRFAVASLNDTNFNGTADDGATLFFGALDAYELRIRNAGNLAVGGIVAATNIGLTGNAVRIANGDLGSIASGYAAAAGPGGILDFNFDPEAVNPDRLPVPSVPIRILKGNMREVDGSGIGTIEAGFVVQGTSLEYRVPKGSVGMIRTRGTTAGLTLMALNLNEDFRSIPAAKYADFAVGGDVQLLDAARVDATGVALPNSNPIVGNVFADKAIGVIRASTINSDGLLYSANASPAPSLFVIDADRKGKDGRIDLIDTVGNLGTAASGGPGIIGGPGSNVRYIHVGGTVFRDRFFGSSSPNPTVLPQGVSRTFTDDSGATYTLTPTGDASVAASGGQLGTLTVNTYQIRSGGLVLVNVTVNPNVRQVDTNGDGVLETLNTTSGLRIGVKGSKGSVDIGQVIVNQTGASNGTTEGDVFSAFDDTTRQFILDPGAPAADVLLTGGLPINVFDLRNTVGGAVGGFRNVINNTDGEIVNISAHGAYRLEADTIGLAQHSTGTAVEGARVQVTNAMPFLRQSNLVLIPASTGTIINGPNAGAAAQSNIVFLRARRGLGNISIVGNIGQLQANSDGKNDGRSLEGIVAPVLVQQAASSDTGNLIRADFGEGILPSGTGGFSNAGLYVDNSIGTVEGDDGADIRGDIVVRGLTRLIAPVEFPLINTIKLNGGSIINADILTVSTFDQSLESNTGFLVPNGTEDNIEQPTAEIGNISVKGKGGIIGSLIVTDDLGKINLSGGTFGMMSSRILTLGNAHMRNITVEGYGMRNTVVDGGGIIDSITIRGDGHELDARNFDYGVRQSENYNIDKYFGTTVNALTDIHKVLGTSKKKGTNNGQTESGTLANSEIKAQRDLKSLDAFRIQGPDPANLPGGFTDTISTLSNSQNVPGYPMRVSIGGTIGTIKVRDKLDGLRLTSSQMEEFNPFNDVRNLAAEVAGRIEKIDAGRSLLGTASIEANGADGSIGEINVSRQLNAHIRSVNDIDSIFVGTDLGTTKARGGGILVDDNLGKLTVKGNVLQHAFVQISDDLGSLLINGDIQKNATVKAGAIDKQFIGGDIIGDLVITG